jgi:hypothetical protein
VQAAADGTKCAINPRLKLTHAFKQPILQWGPQFKPQRRLLLLLLLLGYVTTAAAAAGVQRQLKVPRGRLLLLLLEQLDSCSGCC